MTGRAIPILKKSLCLQKDTDSSLLGTSCTILLPPFVEPISLMTGTKPTSWNRVSTSGLVLMIWSLSSSPYSITSTSGWIHVYRIHKDSVNADGDSIGWKVLLRNKEMKKTLEKSLVLSSAMVPVFWVLGNDAQKRDLALTKYFNKLYFEMKMDKNNRPNREYTDQVGKNCQSLVLHLN
jgi:hypothetical protein